MFNFGKSKKSNLVAPLTGKAIPMSECSDPVFGEKTLGDGVVIIPNKKEVYAPTDGTIVQVADTVHAICISSSDGMEILLHLGIDTVKLKGEGFTCFVKTGDTVKKGDKLAEMDLDFIKEKGYKTESPCIIMNQDDFKNVEYKIGDVVASETCIMEYKK